jgi:nicotinate-nucleotide pyrophosphorylase (carboxylating)
MLPPQWKNVFIPAWFSEDFPLLDYNASLFDNSQILQAEIVLKSKACCLAGRPFVDGVFEYVGCKVEWLYSEGSWIERPSDQERLPIAIISGSSAGILQGERIALNVLARCTAVATVTRRCLNMLVGYTGRVAATRKTTPGFRLMEKYAVAVGGGDPHRPDSGSSLIMLKDNHLEILKTQLGLDVKAAVIKARQVASFTAKVECECRNLEEALLAAEGGADIVMIDNATVEQANAWLPIIREKHPSLFIEVSGGITEASIQAYAAAKPDAISLGSITQAPGRIDFSLNVQ